MASSYEQTNVVILCGGLGTRLRSEIGENQKTMAEVGGEPFLNVWLKSLMSQGLKRFVFCTGYQGEVVEDYYRENPLDCEIVFSHETTPLGTGGAIKNARSLVASDPFLAVNGDSFCEVPLKELMAFHEKQKALATLVVSEARENTDYGLIRLGDDNRICSFEEKSSVLPGETCYLNVGVYCFAKEIFSYMPSKDSFSIEKEFFAHIVEQPFFGFKTERSFMDIGTPQRYQEARHKWEK